MFEAFIELLQEVLSHSNVKGLLTVVTTDTCFRNYACKSRRN
jgi:hypothetical protein